MLVFHSFNLNATFCVKIETYYRAYAPPVIELFYFSILIRTTHIYRALAAIPTIEIGILSIETRNTQDTLAHILKYTFNIKLCARMYFDHLISVLFFFLFRLKRHSY